MFYIFMAASGNLSPWDRIVSWYEGSALKEILTYLKETYFTVNFGAYDNITLGSDAASTARMIIFAMALGIVLAAAMAAHTRNGLGNFTRALHREDCHSPENAKTLMELGFFRNSSIRRELTRGFNLRKVVRCREEEEHLRTQEQKHTEYDEAHKNDPSAKPYEPAPFRVDFLTAHFYIPEELRYRAEIRFDRKGSGWRLVIGTTLVAVIATALLCRYLPDILQLADNIISLMAPEG